MMVVVVPAAWMRRRGTRCVVVVVIVVPAAWMRWRGTRFVVVVVMVVPAAWMRGRATRCVVVVVVCRCGAGFLGFAVDQNVQERAGDAAALGGLRLEGDSRQAQRVETPQRGVAIRDQFQKSRGEHVAGRAGFKLEVERFHGRSSQFVR